jgi:hypothetical protein
MPALSYPTQSVIDSWNVRERGVRDGTSPTEQLEIDNSTADRTFLVKWEYRHDFAKYMVGYAETWTDTGPTIRLSRLLPRAHPELPDLVATKVTSIKGLKWTDWAVDVDELDPYRDDELLHHGHPDYRWTDDQINVFQDAEVVIHYDHAPYDRVEDDDIYATMTEFDRYVERGESQPSAEYLQLPGAVFKYVQETGSANPHGVTIPFNTGRVLPQEKFILTWRRLPENVWTPDGGLYQLIYGTGVWDTVPYLGCINGDPFYGRPMGTVLFENVRPILRKSPLGTGWEWDLEFHFAYDPNGWNWKFYFGATAGTAADNGFYFVSRGSTHYFSDTLPDYESIYNSRDLNNLFDVNY